MGKYIAALDLGSSLAKLAVAKVGDGQLQVCYVGQMPTSNGVRYSRTTRNMKAEIGNLLTGAEEKLGGTKITALHVSYERYPVLDFECQGTVMRPDASYGVTLQEIQAMKDSANAPEELSQKLQSKYSIIGYSAQSYFIDNDWEFSEEEVIDRNGFELTGNFKFFLGNSSDINNLAGSFNGLSINDLQYTFTPTSYIGNVITSDEAKSGIAVMDIGHEVSSVAVFYDGALRSYHSIPFGSSSITADISKIAVMPLDLAEEIKKGFGGCDLQNLGELANKKLRISFGSEKKQLPVKELSEYIAARVNEIVDALLYSIKDDGDKLDSGIVLIGGGAELRGIASWMKRYTGFQVRLGSCINKVFTFEDEEEYNTPEYCNLWSILDEADKKTMYFFDNEEDGVEEAAAVASEPSPVEPELTDGGELFEGGDYEDPAVAAAAKAKAAAKGGSKAPKAERKFPKIKFGLSMFAERAQSGLSTVTDIFTSLVENDDEDK